MRLDPVLVGRADEADGAHGARDEQLHRQDGVDLADELVADIDGGLGHAAAKLEVVGHVVLARPGDAVAAGEEARLVGVGGGRLLVGGRRLLRKGGRTRRRRGGVVGILLRGRGVLCVGHGDVVWTRLLASPLLISLVLSQLLFLLKDEGVSIVVFDGGKRLDERKEVLTLTMENKL